MIDNQWIFIDALTFVECIMSNSCESGNAEDQFKTESKDRS